MNCGRCKYCSLLFLCFARPKIQLSLYYPFGQSQGFSNQFKLIYVKEIKTSSSPTQNALSQVKMLQV